MSRSFCLGNHHIALSYMGAHITIVVCTIQEV